MSYLAKRNFVRGRATLPAPKVPEALGNILPNDTTQATVEVAPYTDMAEGDRVDLYWTGDVSQYTDTVPIGSATVGKTLVFTIGAEQILPNNNVNVSYRVTRATGSIDQSEVLSLRIGGLVTLPAVTVDEADSASDIYLEAVLDGATVRIPASANLAAGDLLSLYWNGYNEAASLTIEHVVSGSETGQSLALVVPYDVIEANAGHGVDVRYSVQRLAGAFELSSVAHFTVVPPIPFAPARSRA